MLVLTRRLNETILIGSDIKIKVLQIRGGQVRIGIEADPSIQVLREEITRKASDIKEEPNA